MKPAMAQPSPVEAVASRLQRRRRARPGRPGRAGTSAGSRVPATRAGPGRPRGSGPAVVASMRVSSIVSTLHAGSVSGRRHGEQDGLRRPRAGRVVVEREPGRLLAAGDGLGPRVARTGPLSGAAKSTVPLRVRDDRRAGRAGTPVEGQRQPAVAGGVGQLEHGEVARHDVAVHQLGGAAHPREPLDALADQRHPAQPRARREVVAGAQRGPGGAGLPQRCRVGAR